MHDVSDSMLVLKFGLHKKMSVKVKKVIVKTRVDDEKKENIELFFEKFKYKGNM